MRLAFTYALIARVAFPFRVEATVRTMASRTNAPLAGSRIMQGSVGVAVKKFKVLRTIVCLVSVLMMDNFVGVKRAMQKLHHHPAVFAYSTFWGPDAYVASAVDMRLAAPPLGMSRASKSLPLPASLRTTIGAEPPAMIEFPTFGFKLGFTDRAG